MASTSNTHDLGTYFWRGGSKVAIVETPDHFTVRMKRGSPPERVARSHGSAHERHLRRLDLDEFSVDSSERDAVMAAVRSRADTEFASHVYAPADEPGSKLYLTDQITVQFRPEVSDARIEQLMADHGLLLEKEVRGVPRAFVVRVGPQARENPIKIANRLALEAADVLSSEPNMAVASKRLYTPSDTLYPEQWHLFNNGGPQLSAAAHIRAAQAWDVTRGDRSVIVAVADDSCDTGHADFQGPGKIVFPRDFAGQDFDPLPELADDNHGTACCGVAVAEETGTGTVGVAPGCALMPIRTSGFIDDGSIEDLCDWVIERGAAVLSCSWSAAARRFPLTLRMREALHRAATVGRGGKGCVLVFAAGNENRPVNGTVDETGWPGNQPGGPTVWLNGFAAHPDVMAVAACSSLATKSAYSNWGAEISVCAPSNNVRPLTYPRITSPVAGRGIVTTDRVGPSGYHASDYTRDFGGTSSACPTVAGAAGLVISANPSLTAREVREVLQSTADRIEDGGTDAQLGMRLGAYDGRGHSPWFGFGRINAAAAVAEAVRRKGGSTGEVVRRSAEPQLAIPDNAGAGVRHEIDVPDDATLVSVTVAVDIAHSFVGDLVVSLTAPSGSTVVLHQRQGGDADNLQRRYDASSTPGLAALAGQNMRGRWVLAVQDLAPVDEGVLRRWSLELVPRSGGVAEVEESPGTRIPDNQPAGIERALAVDAAGLIADIEVALDITHTYIGDLRIALVAPGGAEVLLHDRAGGDRDNLVVRWSSATQPALQALRGTAAQGAWTLRVVDAEAADEGKLNRWSLRLVVN